MNLTAVNPVLNPVDGLADEYRSALCSEYALFRAWREAVAASAAIRRQLLDKSPVLVATIEETFANAQH